MNLNDVRALLNLGRLKYEQNTNNTETTITAYFDNSLGYIIIGFDRQGKISDISTNPQIVRFANTDDGYSSRDLMTILEQIVMHSYRAKILITLPVFGISCVKTTFTLNGGTIGTTTWMKNIQAKIITNMELPGQ